MVVPYLHITTRITDHPYDGMLRDVGGTGFPTLMFLTADGEKLLKHAGPRTTRGFEDSLEDVQGFIDLTKKAASGDAKAQTEVTIRQLELEWHDFAEATKRVGALTKVSAKQKKKLEQLLVNTEVRSLGMAANGNAEKALEAGARFVAMWKDKQIPAGHAELNVFWMVMADYAENQGDKKLFKKILAGFKDTLQNSRYRRGVEVLENRLRRFGK